LAAILLFSVVVITVAWIGYSYSLAVIECDKFAVGILIVAAVFLGITLFPVLAFTLPFPV